MKSASDVFNTIRGIEEEAPGLIKSAHGPHKKTRRGKNVKSAHGPDAVSEGMELALDEITYANMNTRDIHHHLKKQGWGLTRTTGGHDVYVHPKSTKHISVPRHKQLKAPLIMSIMKTAKEIQEDVETINEVSKETLQSYIPKAMGSKSAADFTRGVKMAQGSGGTDELQKTSEKRSTGIHRAIKKLTKEETQAKGRPSQAHPLEGHDYHKKSNDQLHYIVKDAHSAEVAMRGHNPAAESKYADQKNDAATVLHFRKRHGMPNWYAKKYGHKEAVKESLDESRKLEIVREASKNAKLKKKEKKEPNDKFESEPELSSQIVRND